MNREPTAGLFRTAEGGKLLLTRTFRASMEDVWDCITEPERTARWYGPWEGDARPGQTIKVQLIFEEGAPWADLLIERCEPPRRLDLAMVDETATWRLQLSLSESDGTTELRFVQHLDTEEGLAEIGPGWEWYLDKLAAAFHGAPQPAFEEYYPAMKPYFEQLTPQTGEA
ncbi:SRPBCC family protein [Thermoactinospora rubra]|uniref:SRPBCC family protein n=1 Tax=Thermoactinospora rubra TaxID=1088767 RepID=UPI000A0FA66E|nr:SRPBCC family protein [Thermoactinospora rubra]